MSAHLDPQTARESRQQLVEAAWTAYLAWRAACLLVECAYNDWSAGAGAQDRAPAFAEYVAALDREQRAAETYAGLIVQGESPTPPRGTAWIA